MDSSIKTILSGVVFLVFALAACASPSTSTGIAPPQSPSATLPLSTDTPLPSPTPTATPTPLFQLEGPLNASNIANLQQVARLGQGDYVAQDWSPDSQFAALGSGAGVFVLNATDGTLLFSDFPGNTLALAFSADSQFLAITTGTQVIAYNLPNGERQFSLNLDFVANDLAYRLGTSELVIVGAQKDIFGNSLAEVIARAQDGNLINQRSVDKQVTSADFEIAEDGSALFNYSYTRDQFEFFNLNGQRIGSLPQDSPSSMAEAFNAGFFAICNYDANYKAGPLQVYRTNGSLVASLDTDFQYVGPIFISRDGSRLTVVLANPYTIQQYSLPQGVLLSTASFIGYGKPSPDLSRTFDGSVMRDMAGGVELGEAIQLSQNVGEAIALSPDHTLLVVGYQGYDPQGNMQDLWGEVIDARSLLTLRSLTFLPEKPNYPTIDLFTILADGKTLALHAQKDNQVHFWDIMNGEQMDSFTLGIPAVVVSVSADGQRILAADGEGNIEIWERSTATLLTKMSGVDQYIGPYSAAFSPDGQTAAMSGSDVMVIWDLSSNRSTRKESNGPMAISPDGSRLALRLGNDSRFALYDLPTRNLAAEWDYHGIVDDLAFSLDGDVLILNDVGHMAFLGPLDGQALFTLPYDALRFTLSADGFLLATTSYDGTVRLWGLPTSAP